MSREAVTGTFSAQFVYIENAFTLGEGLAEPGMLLAAVGPLPLQVKGHDPQRWLHPGVLALPGIQALLSLAPQGDPPLLSAPVCCLLGHVGA